MGRPATASQLLELRGAYKVNPERRRKKEPKPSSTFTNRVPKHLDADEKACWKEIVKSAPQLVLTGCDHQVVEITAVLLAQFRREKTKMRAASLNKLIACLGHLGMTPSDRTKIQVEKPEHNEFEDL